MRMAIPLMLAIGTRTSWWAPVLVESQSHSNCISVCFSCYSMCYLVPSKGRFPLLYTVLILGRVFASSVRPFVVAISNPVAAKARLSLSMGARSNYFTRDLINFTDELVSMLSEDKDHVLLGCLRRYMECAFSVMFFHFSWNFKLTLHINFQLVLKFQGCFKCLSWNFKVALPILKFLCQFWNFRSHFASFEISRLLCLSWNFKSYFACLEISRSLCQSWNFKITLKFYVCLEISMSVFARFSGAVAGVLSARSFDEILVW